MTLVPTKPEKIFKEKEDKSLRAVVIDAKMLGGLSLLVFKQENGSYLSTTGKIYTEAPKFVYLTNAQFQYFTTSQDDKGNIFWEYKSMG